MDCLYKIDGGAESENIDVNSKNNFDIISTQLSSKLPAPISGKSQSLLSDSRNHSYQDESNENKRMSFNGESNLTNINVTNDTNKSKLASGDRSMLDRSICEETCGQSAKRKCLSVESELRTNTAQCSHAKTLNLNEINTTKENGGDIKIADSQSTDISQPPSNSQNSTTDPVPEISQEIEPRNECENVLAEEVEGPDVNRQFVDTPSDAVDECSSEEEVYSEIDEIYGSDQDLDPENESDLETPESSNIPDCSKTIDALIENVDSEKSDECSDVPVSSSGASKCPEPQNEPILEEGEVIDEMSDDPMTEIKINGECVESISDQSILFKECKSENDSVLEKESKILDADVCEESNPVYENTVNTIHNEDAFGKDNSLKNNLDTEIKENFETEHCFNKVKDTDALEIDSTANDPISTPSNVLNEGKLNNTENKDTNVGDTLKEELLVIDETGTDVPGPMELSSESGLSQNKNDSQVNIPSVPQNIDALTENPTSDVSKERSDKDKEMDAAEKDSLKKPLDGEDFDELDSLIEEFVDTECTDAKPPSPKPDIMVLDSDDEIMEVNSDDDCLIVEDTNKVINIESYDAKVSKSAALKDSRVFGSSSKEPSSKESVILNDTSISEKAISPFVKKIQDTYAVKLGEDKKCLEQVTDIPNSDNSAPQPECSEKSSSESKSREYMHLSFDEKHVMSESSSRNESFAGEITNVKDDQRKRMFDEIEDVSSLETTKKFRQDVIAIEIPYDNNSKLQQDIQGKAFELIPQENSFKFLTTKKILDKIVQHVLAKSMEDVEPINHKHHKQNIEEYEQLANMLDDSLQLFNSETTDLITAQDANFDKKNFKNTPVPTRTVGVNVKIFREADLKNLASASSSYSSAQTPRTVGHPVPKVSAPTLSSNPSGMPPVKNQYVDQKYVTTFQPRLPSPQTSHSLVQSNQLSAPRRPITPAIVTNASRQVVPGQRFTSVSPNVTMTGNPLTSVMSSKTTYRTPGNPNLIINRVQAPNTQSMIDLTREAPMNKGSAVNIPPSTTISNAPRLMGSQNVLVPLNFLQMNNSMQMARGQSVRPTMVLMPGNTSQLAAIGRNAIAIPPFITPQNQRVQTFVVRMTNPGQATTLSSLVNSTSRMPGSSNNIITTSTVTSSAPNNLLVYPSRASKPNIPSPHISHSFLQNKHPAPFPPSPIYQLSPLLKNLPPKPSLKGSRAPTRGIILSWDMVLQSTHASISNYQLYAYQETSSQPVISTLWKKVGDIKALPLPMACTLTQFSEGHRYYFAVRATDTHGRFGPFSDAVDIFYDVK